ncbi:MAG: hypothetical protein EBU21_16995 [Proteobacteria bacterium]|nr:hypothetical protein [Pseudomonadota bacterium]
MDPVQRRPVAQWKRCRDRPHLPDRCQQRGHPRLGHRWHPGQHAERGIQLGKRRGRCGLPVQCECGDLDPRCGRQRGQRGLESTIRSLAVASENTSAANSRIADADIAQSMSEMVRSQILQQAGVSVLAQANQAPSLVLQLLK